MDCLLALAMTQGTDLPNLSSPAAKNISLFDLVETAIKHLPSRAHQEGRYASSRTWSAGCDGRGQRRKTSGAVADGEIVWFWRPDAGAKLAAMLIHRADDGGKKARSPGRARRKP